MQGNGRQVLPYTPKERIEILRIDLAWHERHVSEARQRLIDALLECEKAERKLAEGKEEEAK